MILFKGLIAYKWRALLIFCLMKQKMIDFLTNAIRIQKFLNVIQLKPPILKGDISVEHSNLSMDVTPKHLHK